MTLFKNDDTLEIIYKLFQAYSYFFHQNKTEITSTVTSDTDKVPSCAAVAAYVDELGLSSLGEKPVCSQTSSSITVSVTSKIGFVKVTSIDNFTQSKVAYNSNPSAVTLTVSGLSPSTSYFVEVYNFAGQPFKAQRITTLAENSGV